MAAIVNSGTTSAKSDLAELFDTLQQQRTALIEQVRTLELVARPLFQLEAERLKAKACPDSTALVWPPPVSMVMSLTVTSSKNPLAIEI